MNSEEIFAAVKGKRRLVLSANAALIVVLVTNIVLASVYGLNLTYTLLQVMLIPLLYVAGYFVVCTCPNCKNAVPHIFSTEFCPACKVQLLQGISKQTDCTGAPEKPGQVIQSLQAAVSSMSTARALNLYIHHSGDLSEDTNEQLKEKLKTELQTAAPVQWDSILHRDRLKKVEKELQVNDTETIPHQKKTMLLKVAMSLCFASALLSIFLANSLENKAVQFFSLALLNAGAIMYPLLIKHTQRALNPFTWHPEQIKFQFAFVNPEFFKSLYMFWIFAAVVCSMFTLGVFIDAMR